MDVNLTERIHWLGHDGFWIKDRLNIYIDPYKIDDGGPPADLLLITHDHSDHLSEPDIKKVRQSSTVVVASPACAAKLPDAKILAPGQSTQVGEVVVEAVAAYNTNKYREPGKHFHPKEMVGAGYILTLSNRVRVYHAGDSDLTPEMSHVKCDVALLPCSGTYVMTAEEAADAARAISPKVAIPMHYGALVGSPDDAKRFRDLAAPVKVEILEHHHFGV
ncbi:MAG TPA: MBL fold metallo-hydrolase [Armatimonadota bacterium]|jgi:L-ascorbate metabolism protein UlaG (beta-lactamase superfamily)